MFGTIDKVFAAIGQPCWGLRANAGKNSLAIEGAQVRKTIEQIAANILAASKED